MSEKNYVNIWVTPNGEWIAIPDEFDGIKITKAGYPDKRYKYYEKFMSWVRKATDDSK